MGRISQAHYRKMKNSFRLDVAKFISAAAREGKTVTYGQIAEKFGGTPRGWGDVLGGIAIRCHENSLPVLPVLVVNASTKMPSVDAVLYEDLGLADADAIRSEQQRCIAFDWTRSALGTTP
jgi:alkylated DNA nucleotide flippase Atl1